MTKDQVRCPVGVILAEGSVPAGPVAREAQRPGGQWATSKARGRNPDVRGLLLGAPKPQETIKTNSSRKVKAGVGEHGSNTVIQKVGGREFKVILHHIVFEASLGYIRCYPLSAKI